jgi:hypothetical protein
MGSKAWERVGGSTLIICGWFLGGIGFAEPIPHPWNTSLFLSMFPLIAMGIYLIVREKTA